MFNIDFESLKQKAKEV